MKDVQDIFNALNTTNEPTSIAVIAANISPEKNFDTELDERH